MQFSIVIPVYNVQQYLNACIQSVVSQSMRDFELIVVDDGSTDGSEKICDEWAEKDSRIRVVHQKNKGLADARNIGIDEARGEYLLFLDSDDYWSDLKGLEKLVGVINRFQFPPEVIIFAYQKRNLHTGKVIDVPLTVHFSNQSSTDEYKKALLCARQYSNSACTKAVRKDFLTANKINFPSGRKSEDLVYSRHIFTAMQCFAVSPSPLLVYQINRSGSICSSFGKGNYRDILEQLQDDIQSLETATPEQRLLGRAYWAEQACWFLGYLCLSGQPLRQTIIECASVFDILSYGLSKRTRLVKKMVSTIGKTATSLLLYLYLLRRIG